MAVDTAGRRGSCLGLANPPVLSPPLPDGAIDQATRQHNTFCYEGILASGVFIPSVNWMNEALREWLNNNYGITNLDLEPILDRYLDGDSLTDKTVSFRELRVATNVEER